MEKIVLGAILTIISYWILWFIAGTTTMPIGMVIGLTIMGIGMFVYTWGILPEKRVES